MSIITITVEDELFKRTHNITAYSYLGYELIYYINGEKNRIPLPYQHKVYVDGEIKFINGQSYQSYLTALRKRKPENEPRKKCRHYTIPIKVIKDGKEQVFNSIKEAAGNINLSKLGIYTGLKENRPVKGYTILKYNLTK